LVNWKLTIENSSQAKRLLTSPSGKLKIDNLGKSQTVFSFKREFLRSIGAQALRLMKAAEPSGKRYPFGDAERSY